MDRIKKGLSSILKGATTSVIAKLFGCWFLLILLLCIYWLGFGTPNDRTVALSSLVCGLTSFIFLIAKRDPPEKTACMGKELCFMLGGTLGALWVEFVFWYFERLLGASGIAADPRLGIDYLVTMPWYIIMLLLMLKVQKRYRYSIKEILFFGGVYEIGADGFIGSLFEGNLTRGFFVSILVLPLFVVV